MSEIGERFRFVQNRINDALVKAGREAGSVKLVVVTKGQSAEKVQSLIDAGGRFLGENYPEETADKITQLKDIDQIEWHMIGHIQSRKIKYLARYFDIIESVESLETAQKLDSRFLEAGKKVAILLEVNVSGEESKQGFSLAQKENWGAFVESVNLVEEMSSLELQGLMTMPPLGEDAESSRVYFRQMRELLEYVNQHKSGRKLIELSMGTSFDYTVAVEEGATIVRVGEAIIGARIYA